MKQTFKPFILLIAFFGLAACSQTQKPGLQPTIHPHTNEFSAVSAKVAELQKLYGADQVLVVLDIDNTLLTSHIDLGGDVWYQWQTDKLTIKPTADQKITCLFQDAIGLLYELGPMDLTEPSVPGLISQWQLQSSTVFALTSRSPAYRAATERELAVHDINFSSHGIHRQGGQKLILSGTLARPYSYINGIMMTTGMNKGQMLQHILEVSGQSYQAVVFVDDSEKNITNMAAAYPTTAMDIHLFHYTRIEQQRIDRQGQVLTQAEADQMAEQWAQITDLLNRIFPERKERLSTGCVADG